MTMGRDAPKVPGPSAARAQARKPRRLRAGGAAMEKPRRVTVVDLLDGKRELILEHDGQDYRLRITSNGKLILTK
jgi:hemin uptake protein HemP